MSCTFRKCLSYHVLPVRAQISLCTHVQISRLKALQERNINGLLMAYFIQNRGKEVDVYLHSLQKPEDRFSRHIAHTEVGLQKCELLNVYGS